MKIQTAFILGAGLGTRLQPLTYSRPKILVPIFGKPLLFLMLDHLLEYGISRFVINTHHFPHVFDQFLGGHNGEFSYRGHAVRLVYEPIPLETAGGLRNARQWIGEENFLVVNGDIVTSISLKHFLKSPEKDDACVILGLRSGSQQVGVDVQTGRVLDFRKKLGREGLAYFFFTGIYILRSEIYRWIPAEGPISMMSVFLDLLRAGKRISGVMLDSGFWGTAGDRESYLQLHRQLAGRIPIDQRFQSHLPAGVTLKGLCTVGKNCEIEAGAILEDTIIWDSVKISSRSHLRGCVVCDRSQVDGDFTDLDV